MWKQRLYWACEYSKFNTLITFLENKIRSKQVRTSYLFKKWHFISPYPPFKLDFLRTLAFFKPNSKYEKSTPIRSEFITH